MPAHHYAIFSALYLPHTGGVENFTWHMAHELAARGCAVEIVTMRIDDSPEVETPERGVTVWRLPCRALMGGRLPWTRKCARYTELMGRLDALDIDRVLVNTRFYPHSLEGLAFAERAGARVVVLDHGSAHLVLGNAFVDRVIAAYEHRVTDRGRRFGAVYAGISAKSAEWLAHFGIDTTLVVPNAIDAPAFRAASSGRDFKSELGIAPDELLVAFAGRLTPEKGVGKLVEAARLLVDEPVRFVLAGAGFMEAEIRAAELANVNPVGNLVPADLSALLQAADVFCLPSRSEGFCTSLLEASACGVPGVVSDFGGARELVPDEGYGWVLTDPSAQDVAQCLRACARNRESLADMGERARVLVEERYSWGGAVAALDTAFGDAAGA